MEPLPGSPSAPPELQARYSDREWTVAWQYGAAAVTYRLDRKPEDTLFLKLARPGGHPTLEQEGLRMRWAASYLPVPTVVECGADSEVTWLLTEGLRGSDATRETWAAEPERLVRTLAAGLRVFHGAPVLDCPFDFRLDRALDHARKRVQLGSVNREHDFHREHTDLSPESALARLQRTRPESESLVVCHGDYCPPNVIVRDWSPAGFVDLGELGVADRWWDLAVATWSLTWNLGPGFEELFLAEYGVERDGERSDYYRLLYDLVS